MPANTFSDWNPALALEYESHRKRYHPYEMQPEFETTLLIDAAHRGVDIGSAALIRLQNTAFSLAHIIFVC